MDYLFASRHKGLRFKSPGGYLCETGILLLALSRYSGPDHVHIPATNSMAQCINYQLAHILDLHTIQVICYGLYLVKWTVFIDKHTTARLKYGTHQSFLRLVNWVKIKTLTPL